MSQTTSVPVAEAPAHFSASHRVLSDALKTAALAVPAHRPVPVLGGVIADAQDSNLVIRTFDYEVSVTVTVPAEPGSSGRSVLDYDELKATLAAAVAGETKTAAGQTVVTVDGGQLSTPQVSVPLTVHPLHEYPSLPIAAPPVATVDGPEFFRQLARVLPAAGKDDTLPEFTMVRLELSGGSLRMAATDRYRIAVADVPTQPAEANADAAESGRVALIPARVLVHVAKYLGTHTGPVTFGIRDDEQFPLVAITIGVAEVTIRSYECDFPKVDGHLPTARHVTVTVGRASMVKAAKKAAALTKARGMATTGSAVAEWNVEGWLSLAPYYGEEGQAKVRGAKVTADIVHGIAEQMQGRTLTLNARFLLDALNTFASDTIALHLQADHDGQFLKPVLFTEGHAITGDGYRHLIQPIRLKG